MDEQGDEQHQRQGEDQQGKTDADVSYAVHRGLHAAGPNGIHRCNPGCVQVGNVHPLQPTLPKLALVFNDDAGACVGGAAVGIQASVGPR